MAKKEIPESITVTDKKHEGIQRTIFGTHGMVPQAIERKQGEVIKTPSGEEIVKIGSYYWVKKTSPKIHHERPRKVGGRIGGQGRIGR